MGGGVRPPRQEDHLRAARTREPFLAPRFTLAKYDVEDADTVAALKQYLARKKSQRVDATRLQAAAECDLVTTVIHVKRTKEIIIFFDVTRRQPT